MAVATIYEIDHKCGHAKEVDLSKKPAGKRASLVVWLKEQPCLDCKRKETNKGHSEELKAERAAAAAEAKEFAEALELPELTGSAKQQAVIVPWALTARHELLKAAYEALVEQGDLDEEEFETRILVPAREIEYAAWWVDNRDAESADIEELVSTASTDEVSNAEEG